MRAVKEKKEKKKKNDGPRSRVTGKRKSKKKKGKAAAVTHFPLRCRGLKKKEASLYTSKFCEGGKKENEPAPGESRPRKKKKKNKNIAGPHLRGGRTLRYKERGGCTAFPIRREKREKKGKRRHSFHGTDRSKKGKKKECLAAPFPQYNKREEEELLAADPGSMEIEGGEVEILDLHPRFPG